MGQKGLQNFKLLVLKAFISSKRVRKWRIRLLHYAVEIHTLMKPK